MSLMSNIPCMHQEFFWEIQVSTSVMIIINWTTLLQAQLDGMCMRHRVDHLLSYTESSEALDVPVYYQDSLSC